MHRRALDYLQSWSTRGSRRPLVVRGARQVGKSYLVRRMAEACFADTLEINLEADSAAPSLFESREPIQIIELLEARYGMDVRPGATLLFLDEIQAAPKLISCLRYFYEKMPGLHVIAAGSLLEFSLREHDHATPVGRIEYLHLGPMDFEEFLHALGQDKLNRLLRSFQLGGEIPAAIHAELMRRLRQFFIVGGMPASVEAFVQSGGLREIDGIKQSILSTYREDFAKYSRHVDRHRLDKVFVKVPRLVGSKFMYSRVDREERSRDLSRALEMLCLARVTHKVRHTAANGIPLGAEADDRRFKVLFLDVGMLLRSSGLGILDIEQAEDLMLINAGAVCEQFIGQHLLHSGEPYDEPEVFCWMREKSQSKAEVDYVISVGSEVIPIEVKAGKTGTLRSLHVFLREKNRTFALRFNADPPSVFDGELPGADARQFRLLSLPLYMACQAHRLVRACTAELSSAIPSRSIRSER